MKYSSKNHVVSYIYDRIMAAEGLDPTRILGEHWEAVSEPGSLESKHYQLMVSPNELTPTSLLRVIDSCIHVLNESEDARLALATFLMEHPPLEKDLKEAFQRALALVLNNFKEKNSVSWSGDLVIKEISTRIEGPQPTPPTEHFKYYAGQFIRQFITQQTDYYLKTGAYKPFENNSEKNKFNEEKIAQETEKVAAGLIDSELLKFMIMTELKKALEAELRQLLITSNNDPDNSPSVYYKLTINNALDYPNILNSLFDIEALSTEIMTLIKSKEDRPILLDRYIGKKLASAYFIVDSKARIDSLYAQLVFTPDVGKTDVNRYTLMTKIRQIWQKAYHANPEQDPTLNSEMMAFDIQSFKEPNPMPPGFRDKDIERMIKYAYCDAKRRYLIDNLQVLMTLPDDQPNNQTEDRIDALTLTLMVTDEYERRISKLLQGNDERIDTAQMDELIERTLNIYQCSKTILDNEAIDLNKALLELKSSDLAIKKSNSKFKSLIEIHTLGKAVDQFIQNKNTAGTAHTRFTLFKKTRVTMPDSGQSSNNNHKPDNRI